MNGLSPGIRRSLPAGSGGAGWTGAGTRSDAWARETLECSASKRPPRPATAAVPAAIAPVFRNVRRSAGRPAQVGKVGRDEDGAGLAGEGGSADDADVLSGARSAPAGLSARG